MWYDDFTWTNEWKRLLRNGVNAAGVDWCAAVVAEYWSAAMTFAGGTKESCSSESPDVTSADGQKKTGETDGNS